MSPANRRTLLQFAVILLLAALILRRGSYALERVALEVRYFWWLVLILGGGLWLLLSVGRGRK